MSAVEVELQHPVTVGGREITALSLRRPTTGDVRKMSKQTGTQMDQMCWLIGRLGGLSPDEVDALDYADLAAASKVIEGFMAG